MEAAGDKASAEGPCEEGGCHARPDDFGVPEDEPRVPS